VRALAGVDLAVEPGQLVGLIGPNGAGKTTLVDAVCGFVPATGVVRFDGQPIEDLAPHRRARAGLARTWQSLELFDDLTVAENLAVAGSGVAEALAATGLDDVADRLPTELSQGRRKLVGLARALAAGPTLLCLDEPAAGLDSDESLALGRRIRALVDGGLSVLLIDHDMGLVLGVSDHVVVLEFGRVIASGPPDEVRADERVVAAYLGASA
jgi:branched-chain amino acid transport system ATP-binding protein